MLHHNNFLLKTKRDLPCLISLSKLFHKLTTLIEINLSIVKMEKQIWTLSRFQLHFVLILPKFFLDSYPDFVPDFNWRHPTLAELTCETRQ